MDTPDKLADDRARLMRAFRQFEKAVPMMSQSAVDAFTIALVPACDCLYRMVEQTWLDHMEKEMDAMPPGEEG